MKRMSSPAYRTTVLARVKTSRALHAGFAGLDPDCAPWFTKLWAMDEGGLRWGLQTKEVTRRIVSNENTARHGNHSAHVARARGARLENPRNLLGDSPVGSILDDRQRQLRDEGMSSVNQHADIRLIHRRMMLLVP